MSMWSSESPWHAGNCVIAKTNWNAVQVEEEVLIGAVPWTFEKYGGKSNKYAFKYVISKLASKCYWLFKEKMTLIYKLINDLKQGKSQMASLTAC